MLPNYNSNTIVLIPKNNEPNTLNHYRPITLANFKFKIISKIITDRLASILPCLISNEQKGFILGRNIKDSICLTFEAINILGNKSYSGNVALKIDKSKAFDTLSWDFLLKTLNCFGFSSKFCNWISTLLSLANHSIGVNGKQAGFFKCSNGVRQGDPLSPLLFFLAEEEYALNFGQIYNKSKSLIYAGGMTYERHKSLADMLGFSMANPPFVYLGAPIFVGRPKANYFFFIADKIKVRLAHWKASSTVKQISKWMRNFLWSGNLEQRKIVTVAWKECCQSMKEGGIGIKSLYSYNQATNFHLCWSFVKGNQSWNSLLASRIKRKKKIISYHIKSYIWTSIKDYYETVLENSKWIIGDGSKINFWLDTWLDEPIAAKFKIPVDLHKHIKVKVKDWLVGKDWCIPNNILTAYPNLLHLISKIIIPDMDIDDCIIWRETSDGDLSLKQAYGRYEKRNQVVPWANFVWNKHVPPVYAIVVWKVLCNRLPTDDNFTIRGFYGPSICSLCGANSDSLQHIFFDNSFVIPIWKWLLDKLQFAGAVCNIKDCLDLMQINRSPQAKAVMLSTVCSLFYHV
ncbi:uncharacterized protein LOC131604944 [Vicia villosa]|uniref:uncharacterized protein LOC131604944 n=1 Tax=Vicia villosa TaxID=3911 RepID=UPI00273A7C49|nr:uncharacterized protein LOC131604944 [Vicia villosa]